MDHLETEGRNPASARLDELSAKEIVNLMCQEDARVVPAVASQAEAIARAVEVIADRLRNGGRLIYAGAGTSGRLGVLDATECPPTFSTPPGLVVGLIAGGPAALTQAVEGAEDRPELAQHDLEGIGFSGRDVLVGIATSGRTPYVLGAVAHARAVGAFTIGLACNSAAELSGAVDLAIVPVVGPEVLSGSTRLKAGTATKLVLNILSTGAMVLLGKTFGNLMVDLRASNSKLRARTNRIVRQLTGLPAESAGELLQRCGGELKTALVSHLAGVTPEEARACLASAQGQVRRALGGSLVGPASGPRHEDLVLGVDGGGSHTVALLACGEVIVGRGVAGPSNMQVVGPAGAFAAIEEAVAGAFREAGRERGPVASACLGLAGAGRVEDQERVREWARRVGLADRVEATSDASILVDAGTPEGHGLVLVAGTGSIALGRTADGREERAGGWGPLLGDEGSAYALALAGLRAAVRASEGRGPRTVLLERFLERMGLSQARELVPAVHGGKWDRAALAGLAPVVIEASGTDEVARALMAEGARDLAAMAAVVAGRLGMSPVPLALAGGLLVGSEVYRERVLAEIAQRGVAVGPVCVVSEPALGAVRRARRTAERGRG